MTQSLSNARNHNLPDCDDVIIRWTDANGVEQMKAAHPMFPLTPTEMQAEIKRLTRLCEEQQRQINALLKYAVDHRSEAG